MRIVSVITSIMIGLLALTACGSGGSGNGDSSKTVISGVASKGIIKNGAIKAYALNADGGKGTLLNETVTDGNGAYRADLGTYRGAFLIEASGNYTDEATGNTKTIPAGSPLRAAVDNAAGDKIVVVTPLTELAVQCIEDPLTHKINVTNIATGNAQISALYKVDILKTMPIDPLFTNTAATNEQKQYALILAAFATLMQSNGKDLPTVIADVRNSIGADNKLAIPAAAQFQAALAGFAASSLNRTGITDVSTTPLITIGGNTRPLTISVSSSAPLISSIEITVTLPPGVTIKAANGTVVSTALLGSGNAAVSSIASGYYTPPSASMRGNVKLAVVSATSFAAGEFATLQCDIAPDATPKGSDFILSVVDVMDDKDVPVTGASVSAQLN